MKKLVILVSLIGTLSCQYNENVLEELDVPDIHLSNNRLVFSSMEIFRATLGEISELDDQSFINWQNQFGFKSFKTICDKAYDRVLSSSYATQEELLDEVSRNKDYMYIDEPESGELVLETLDKGLLFSSLIAADRTFQIESIVYKVLEGEVFFTSIENLEILQLIDETNCESYREYEEISSYKEIEMFESAKKGSTCFICDIDGTHTNESAKRRVYLRISALPSYYYSSPYYYVDVQFNSKSISYKKVLGIWVKYKTTHVHDVDYEVSWSFFTDNGLPWPNNSHHDFDGSYEDDYYVTSSSTTKEYNYYRTEYSVQYSNLAPQNLESDLDYWDCRARTTGTNGEWIYLQCNIPIPSGDCLGF